MEYVNVTNHNIDMLFCKKLKNGECDGRKDGENYKRKCRKCPYDDGGEVKTIEPSGISIKATPKDKFYEKAEDDVLYVETEFEPNKKSKRELAELEDEYFNLGKNAVFIGSIIAAQAFPERVVAMVPVPGYERVPLNEKLVRSDKFTIFPKNK